MPVDSTTTSTPKSRHGNLPGSRSASTLDRLPGDRHGIAPRSGDIAGVRAEIRIVLEKVRALGGAGQVVDGDDLDVRMAFEQRLREIAADPAETVNPNAHSLRNYRAWFTRPCRCEARREQLSALKRLRRSAWRWADSEHASSAEGLVGMGEPQLRAISRRGGESSERPKAFSTYSMIRRWAAAAAAARSRLAASVFTSRWIRFLVFAQRTHVFEVQHRGERAHDREHVHDRFEVFVVEHVAFFAHGALGRAAGAAQTSTPGGAARSRSGGTNSRWYPCAPAASDPHARNAARISIKRSHLSAGLGGRSRNAVGSAIAKVGRRASRVTARLSIGCDLRSSRSDQKRRAIELRWVIKTLRALFAP